MNEPTRGIDVGARADIYRIMREFCAQGYALVMTSSDLEEIVGLGDIVITMYRGRQVASYRRATTWPCTASSPTSPIRSKRRRRADVGRRPFDWTPSLAPPTRRKRALLAIRILALAALIAFAVRTPGFLSTVSLISLLTTMSFIGCVAIGMTFITLSGNIMSFALGATLGATTIVFTLSLPLGLAGALVRGVRLQRGAHRRAGLHASAISAPTRSSSAWRRWR